MEKIKLPIWQRIKTLLIVLLTLSMLLLAGIYIGGAHFSGGTAAIRTSALPSGTAILGKDAELRLPVYEKGLLPVAAASICIGGEGGGAYGTEEAAGTLLAFAADPIHRLLAQGASITEVSPDAFAEATKGDLVCLNLLSALPYQMLYALTGEFSAAAGSPDAISADRLLLSFTENGNASLFLSDGNRFYRAEAEVSVKPAELTAMAHDSRLASFSLTEYGILLSDAAPHAQKISLQSASISQAQYNLLLSLLGYTPETAVAPLTAEGTYGTAVAPHGSLQATESGFLYTAARDSGIPISSFLDTAKSELDIGIYDILLASVSLGESLREIAPAAFAEGATLYLDGFYRTEDTYTVQLGIAVHSIAVSGDAYPFFAKLTVQGGMFKSMDIRCATLTQNKYTGMLFSSLWQYSYAAESAKIDSLRLYYRVDALENKWIDASWYYTGQKQEGEVDA